MNAIIHDNEATIAPGKTGSCKETSLTKYFSMTIPERISIEEIDEIKFIQNHSEQR